MYIVVVAVVVAAVVVVVAVVGWSGPRVRTVGRLRGGNVYDAVSGTNCVLDRFLPHRRHCNAGAASS